MRGDTGSTTVVKSSPAKPEYRKFAAASKQRIKSRMVDAVRNIWRGVRKRPGDAQVT